jgi:RNA polymerase sigma-70 factor (ECF subfamily)
LRRDEIEAIYRDLGHVVLRRAQAILRNRADAEELTQELFASLVSAPPAWDGRASLVTYLYRAATNRALNTLRDRRNRRRLLGEDSPPSAAAPATGDLRVMALEALDRLPEELAKVAVYAFIDEMTHEEIAAVLGCSRRQVGNLVDKIHASLRRAEVAS